GPSPPPPPPPPATEAAGMIAIPSRSYGSPNTRLTVIASLACATTSLTSMRPPFAREASLARLLPQAHPIETAAALLLLESGPLAPLRRLALALALLTGALALPAPAGATTTAWADVPHGYWAKPAIDFVAHTHSWMEDYGATQFKPDVHETRKYLARAMFRT